MTDPEDLNELDRHIACYPHDQRDPIRRDVVRSLVADARSLAAYIRAVNYSHAALAAAEARAEKAEAERDEARQRLLSAAGDDLCRLSQEEIKAMTAGEVKIPPKEEFLASCERFHAQVAGESGVIGNCLTLAQLLAENEKQRRELAELKRRVERVRCMLADNQNRIGLSAAGRWEVRGSVRSHTLADAVSILDGTDKGDDCNAN